jgi:hypothetical protein
MILQGCLQALNLSTHRSIIGRSTAEHMIRTVVLIHLGVISSVAHLYMRWSGVSIRLLTIALSFLCARLRVPGKVGAGGSTSGGS